MSDIQITDVNKMPNLRVFYEKTGRAKYISHLDINRCMQRALRRAEIPVWYTEGFNPHPYTTFALPLSLGYESLCETMDLRITRVMSCEEISQRLNNTLPEGLTVKKTALQKFKPEKIKQAFYHIRLNFADCPPEAALEHLLEFDKNSSILVMKRTKKGMKEIDIRPDVSLHSLYVENSLLNLKLFCAAGIEKNINPTLYLDAFTQAAELEIQAVHVLRTAVLMENGQPFE